MSGVSFGAWAIGSAWGAVDDDESVAALHRAIDRGVNFMDATMAGVLDIYTRLIKPHVHQRW